MARLFGIRLGIIFGAGVTIVSENRELTVISSGLGFGYRCEFCLGFGRRDQNSVLNIPQKASWTQTFRPEIWSFLSDRVGKELRYPRLAGDLLLFSKKRNELPSSQRYLLLNYNTSKITNENICGRMNNNHHVGYFAA